MNDKYNRTATTVSSIRYHFVFCPYRQRKIFKIPGVEARFKELVTEICRQNQYEILAMECHIDHCHLFLSALPTQAPSDIMHAIKGTTSRVIRSEFQQLSRSPSLWTRSYFVSTAGDVSSETIQRYVETQKTK